MLVFLLNILSERKWVYGSSGVLCSASGSELTFNFNFPFSLISCWKYNYFPLFKINQVFGIDFYTEIVEHC